MTQRIANPVADPVARRRERREERRTIAKMLIAYAALFVAFRPAHFRAAPAWELGLDFLLFYAALALLDAQSRRLVQREHD
jgi:hypothetical protein